MTSLKKSLLLPNESESKSLLTLNEVMKLRFIVKLFKGRIARVVRRG